MKDQIQNIPKVCFGVYDHACILPVACTCTVHTYQSEDQRELTSISELNEDKDGLWCHGNGVSVSELVTVSDDDLGYAW